MKTPPNVGTIKNNEFEMDMKDLWSRYKAKFEGKRVIITIKLFRKTRTQPQLGYYFAVIIPLMTALMQYHRHEEDLCHRVLKDLFLRRMDEHGNHYTPTLAELVEDPVKADEMASYCNAISDFAATEYNYYIPPPNQVDHEDVHRLVNEIRGT